MDARAIEILTESFLAYPEGRNFLHNTADIDCICPRNSSGSGGGSDPCFQSTSVKQAV